jgi:hypothetical protein
MNQWSNHSGIRVRLIETTAHQTPSSDPVLNSTEAIGNRSGGSWVKGEKPLGMCRVKRLEILLAGLKADRMTAMKASRRGMSTGISRPIRLLAGSGIRRAEVCGLATSAPDGLPDLMVDSMHRSRVELRVRWDGGAKGRKSRRIPITPKLAAALKRYEARHRLEARISRLHSYWSSDKRPEPAYAAASTSSRLASQRLASSVPFPSSTTISERFGVSWISLQAFSMEQ